LLAGISGQQRPPALALEFHHQSQRSSAATQQRCFSLCERPIGLARLFSFLSFCFFVARCPSLASHRSSCLPSSLLDVELPIGEFLVTSRAELVTAARHSTHSTPPAPAHHQHCTVLQHLPVPQDLAAAPPAPLPQASCKCCRARGDGRSMQMARTEYIIALSGDLCFCCPGLHPYTITISVVSRLVSLRPLRSLMVANRFGLVAARYQAGPRSR
jgi:hypothetical protein